MVGEEEVSSEEPGEDRVASRDREADLTDDRVILGVDSSTLLRGLFGSASEAEVESATGFARHLSRVGINVGNYPLYLRLLQTNNHWIVDALLGKRSARLLFSSIRPNAFLVSKAFELLSFWHPGEIYAKVLESIIGIVENAYHEPDDGYKIYPLRLADLNSVGKFLDEGLDQFAGGNALILQVLDRMTRIGLHETSPGKRLLAKHAYDIRMAYFDDSKSCTDVIPALLLTPIEQGSTEVAPSAAYRSYLKKLD